MITTLLGISFAYVAVCVLLLAASLFAPVRWWVKAPVIVVASFFFIEEFYASKGLMGWPGTDRLPGRFQLLWTRVVEPDPKLHDPGAIFFWVEEVDANDVPSGVPRSYRLPYTKPLADKSLKARDEIMSGNPQEGVAEDLEENETEQRTGMNMPNTLENTNQAQNGNANLDLSQLHILDQTQGFKFLPYCGPRLVPKEGEGGAPAPSPTDCASPTTTR
jgi:hypothetical protein